MQNSLFQGGVGVGRRGKRCQEDHLAGHSNDLDTDDSDLNEVIKRSNQSRYILKVEPIDCWWMWGMRKKKRYLENLQDFWPMPLEKQVPITKMGKTAGGTGSDMSNLKEQMMISGWRCQVGG